MYKLILLRHGQSVWNQEPRRFTGWTDVDISETGIAEARDAGRKLKAAGFKLDLAFASLLKRATYTLQLALEEMGQGDLPVKYSWRLNERHYGALQGLTHAEMAAKYSKEQVQIWRRSYSVRPPEVDETDPRYPGNDAKYATMDKNEIPRGESLADTIDRVLPYWESEILPAIKQGKSVIIAASGNSLRALIKHLDGIGDDEIVSLEIKTGVPLVYELEEVSLKPIRSYYL